MTLTIPEITAEDARGAAARFRDLVLDSMLSIDDQFLVDGLDEKTATYILMMARRNPAIRPSLATAARGRAYGYERTTRRSPRTVYFIQQGTRGPIKIGVAVDIAARIKTLQTGCAEPLRVLATVPGSQQAEHALHRQFADLRMEGEWFSPAPELIAYIKGCCS